MKKVRGEWVDEQATVIPPPSTYTVHQEEPKPLLYLPDGRPLVRRPVGFETKRREDGR